MKQPVWAFWIAVKFWLIGLIGSSAALALDPNLQEVKQADFAFSTSTTPPALGWQNRPLPQIRLGPEAHQKMGRDVAVWVRFGMDRGTHGKGPIALYGDETRHRMRVWLNGVDIYRNYAGPDDAVAAGMVPHLVALPEQLLHPGGNQLLIRVEPGPHSSFGVGHFVIGPLAAVTTYYRSKYFQRITGPRMANTVMLFLSLLALALWLFGQRSREYVLLATTGLCWFITNYHFYMEVPPINAWAFEQVSYVMVIAAVMATLGFCIEFVRLPERRGFYWAMLVSLLLAFGYGIIAGEQDHTGLPGKLILLVLVVLFIGLLLRNLWQSRLRDYLIILAALLLGTLFQVHDLARTYFGQHWDGLGFFLQPYTALTLFTIFLISLGRRFLQAQADLRDINATLAIRIEETRAELARSEAARQAAEVERAIESERGRLMREMHDGIGANLVTALAIAKNHDESPSTIGTLKRAIADLKLTVDSLAPVDGDVVTLLANLRHRLEPDLREAGLKTIWQVELCPPLAWLDAANALQMLRIVQEGVSNILVHAKATTLVIGCKPQADGVEICLIDNGLGFDQTLTGKGVGGKGIENMLQRAKSLQGRLRLDSVAGQGTTLSLWLPHQRI